MGVWVVQAVRGLGVERTWRKGAGEDLIDVHRGGGGQSKKGMSRASSLLLLEHVMGVMLEVESAGCWSCGRKSCRLSCV